jgi:hypothetical protein
MSVGYQGLRSTVGFNFKPPLSASNLVGQGKTFFFDVDICQEV